MIGRVFGKLRAGAQWSTTVFRSKALILLYHRVAEVRSDPWALAVTPQHFAEHLEVLRRYCEPISLRTLTTSIENGSVADGSVAVTFDDGYADNLHEAKPLLEDFDVPATVFVSTGAFANSRLFWWDELDRLVLQPPHLPAELSLEIAGVAHHWSLGPGAEWPHPQESPDRSWRGWDKPRTARQRLYRELWQLMRPLAVDQRENLLDRLATWSRCSPGAPAEDRTLLPDEVCSLASAGFIEIGAHTVNHPTLASLPTQSQRNEIQASKHHLEALIDSPVDSFAYPHGGPADYTRDTVRLVSEAGFRCSCAAVNGVVVGSTDLFRLPRLYMEDWDGADFARVLQKWLRVQIP